MSLTQRMAWQGQNVKKFKKYLRKIKCTEPKTRRVTICYDYYENSKEVIMLCDDCTDKVRKNANRLDFKVHTELLRRS